MPSPATRRLLKDLETLNKVQETHSVFAQPLSSDVFTWVAVILGPPETPFEGGSFTLSIFFDETYPQNAPEVCFLCPMFHPNVYTNGDLCLDILKSKWSPSFDVLGILISIQSLLNDPNIDSPANAAAAKLFLQDYESYKKKIKECVEQSNKLEEIPIPKK